MDVKRLVLGGVLGIVLHAPVLAEPGDGPNRRRDHRHQESNYQMHDYEPVATTNVFYDYAKVVSVHPVVRTVRVDEPHQYCWEEAVYRRGPRKSYTALIVGGLVGGVIGNQVGGGTGNDLLTVGGVILGASIAHDIAERSLNHRYHSGIQERCQSVHDYHEEQRIQGYDVRYVYNGRSFVRRMDYPPGRKLRVRVKVTPDV